MTAPVHSLKDTPLDDASSDDAFIIPIPNSRKRTLGPTSAEIDTKIKRFVCHTLLPTVLSYRLLDLFSKPYQSS